MGPDERRAFLAGHHRAVLATHRADGRPQMSPIVCALGPDGEVLISTRQATAKVANVKRRPQVSLCVLDDNFFGQWSQFDGVAEIVPLPDAMEGLELVYRQVAGEHPDWDDFRAAMHREERVLLRIAFTSAS